MRVVDCKIIHNKPLNEFIYEMTVTCIDTKWIHPGKFINIHIDGCYLRRPMAVSGFSANSFSFIYEIVGAGTKKLSLKQPSEIINILINLGNQFDYQVKTGKPLLVAGGAGIGPILCLASWLKTKKIPFVCVLGFATKAKVISTPLLKDLKDSVHICTDDGSFGEKGNVVEIINKHKLNDLYYYTCGPTVMMKALFKNNSIGGQISLDARMGCGFGACMGCSIQTKNGPQRICRNGPIFYSKDLLW